MSLITLKLVALFDLVNYAWKKKAYESEFLYSGLSHVTEEFEQIFLLRNVNSSYPLLLNRVTHLTSVKSILSEQ
jgi:hypothetical protein